MSHYYCTVSPGCVSPDIAEAITAAKANACKDLGLDVTKIQITPIRKLSGPDGAAFDTKEPICGQMSWLRPNEIFVVADLSPALAMKTVAHELKHCADAKAFDLGEWAINYKLIEDRADTFAMEFKSRHVALFSVFGGKREIESKGSENEMAFKLAVLDFLNAGHQYFGRSA